MRINNGNIEDPAYWMGTFWDWGWLNWCFKGSKIKIEDIDGHVEYRGYHLYIETKTPGAKIPTAQEIVHLTLQEAGNNTILVIWGDPNDSRAVRLYGMNGTIFEGTANNIDVALLVRGWYDDIKNRDRIHNPSRPVPLDRATFRDLAVVLEKLWNTIKDE